MTSFIVNVLPGLLLFFGFLGLVGFLFCGCLILDDEGEFGIYICFIISCILLVGATVTGIKGKYKTEEYKASEYNVAKMADDYDAKTVYIKHDEFKEEQVICKSFLGKEYYTYEVQATPTPVPKAEYLLSTQEETT